ncbi:MAG TPA: hypothetical protein VHZ52_09530, partial [Acidobacteriaceae bacterium]|jgi:hypothetical protein|nr:hypothetical protein [Acidobacteriaceae bacterium]
MEQTKSIVEGAMLVSSQRSLQAVNWLNASTVPCLQLGRQIGDQRIIYTSGITFGPKVLTSFLS